MPEPDSPAWTLGRDSVETVWAARRGLSVPTAVEIDADDETVVDGPHPTTGATTVRLTLALDGLTDEVVQDLLERLVGIRGVRPPAFPIAEHTNAVSVPLLAPSTIADYQLEWTITDQLAVVHADRCDVYFAVAGEDLRVGDRPMVELTPAQTWLLIRALTTIRCWQCELETAFDAAATQRRVSLHSAGSTPPAAAADTRTAAAR